MPRNFITCNLDAAFHNALNRTSYGLCLRDDEGRFLLAKSGWIDLLLHVEEGEALALLFALRWAGVLELEYIVFEFDSKLMIDSVAHKLARAASSLASHHVFTSIPACIMDDMYLEMK